MIEVLQPQLDRIEAKLDRLIGGPEKETIGLREVMRILDCKSRPSAYRNLALIGVRAYSKNKYLLKDLRNAIARKQLEDQLAEVRSESRQIPAGTPNPHDD